MAPPRGKFIVEAATNNGPIKAKDFHALLFKLYSLDKHGRIKVRRITGKAVASRKTKRKNEWEKRQK